MLKKLVIAVSACVGALLISVSANAATVSKGTVNADALNVRSMPSTEGISMGLLPTNSEVTILSSQDNWYRIYYGGAEAYVCADYIIITQEALEVDIPAEPVVTPGSETTQSPATYPASTGVIPSYAGSEIPGEKLIELAKLYIGTPYVYGGSTPEGFDCSGFVKYCYSLMNVELNRVARDQALNGYEVPVNEMLPGDILCFNEGNGSTSIGHSGLYVGNGYFIHSPRTGYTVEIVALDQTSYGRRIQNVRRIFN